MSSIIALGVVTVSIAAEMWIIYRAQARAEYNELVNTRLARYAVR